MDVWLNIYDPVTALTAFAIGMGIGSVCGFLIGMLKG